MKVVMNTTKISCLLLLAAGMFFPGALMAHEPNDIEGNKQSVVSSIKPVLSKGASAVIKTASMLTDIGLALGMVGSAAMSAYIISRGPDQPERYLDLIPFGLKVSTISGILLLLKKNYQYSEC